MKEPYEFIDHTADIAIKASGKTLAEAFENAAKGMFDIITDKSEIESVGQYGIELEAPDLEQLLVDWLSELLFINTSQNLVFGFFKVELDEKKKKLSAKIFGENRLFGVDIAGYLVERGANSRGRTPWYVSDRL